MKKLWNIPDMPVWSISTCSSEGAANMNICSYMTPVSMKPKKYVIAVYSNTQTHTNIQNSKYVIAQLLSQEQALLVRRLGKKSSLHFPKKMQSILNTTGVDNALHFLPQSIGYFLLKKETALLKAGDHDIAVFSVEKTVYLNPLKNVLTLTFLREKNIIA